MANKVVTPDLMFNSEEKLQTLIDEKPWMKDRTFIMASKNEKDPNGMEQVRSFIDKAIETGKCVIDFETTGLSTRVRKVKDPVTGEITKVPAVKLVGVGLCYDHFFAMYIPLGHQIDDELNLSEAEVLEEIRRLCKNAVTIYHNAKYDTALLRIRGIYIDGYRMFEDTQILARLYDANQKDLKLKNISERFINQPMLKFKEMVQSTERFDLISPLNGYVYGASDAICTFDLYNFFTSSQIVKDQTMIYNIEKRVVFVVMEMESNYVKVDVDCLKEMKAKAEKRIAEIKTEIYALAKHEFNIGSPLQLGKVLFEELGFKCPGPKTANNQYPTDNAALKILAQTQPICKKLIAFRSLEKSLGTYINNLLMNHDEDGCIKLGFNQSGTDTGRFSSPGGQGIEEDGYCGVNVQSIPKATKDNDSGEDLPDIRKAMVARPGKTMVAADYENEEMRVAANLSNETTWIDAVSKGIDFHTATGAIIAGKSTSDVTSEERKLGKCVAKGTLIASERGWVPIEELKVGDLVFTHKLELKPIEKVWDMGIKPGIVIYTDKIKVTCGLNHRFLNGGFEDSCDPTGIIEDEYWTRAEDLKEGQYVYTVPYQSEYTIPPFAYQRDSITKKEMVAEVDLRDISVEGDHTYIAQGFITHNTTNFLALYMGGARTLAANAGISEPEAKRVLSSFYAGVPRLKSWMEREIKNSRKSKFVKTLLGRTRPLAKFYDTDDRFIQSHGDRCVANTKIQGCLQGHERCLTTEGYLPILEIKKLKEDGKDIKVWTGISWETFDVVGRGPAQLAEIELINGLKIDVDTRHEVLVEGPDGYEFKKFQDLDENTKICTSVPTEKEFGHYPSPFSFHGETTNSKNFEISSPEQWQNAAYFLGCLIGDGVVGVIEGKEHHIIALCFGEDKIKNVLPGIRVFIESLGISNKEPILSKGSNGIAYNIPIYSKGLVLLVQKMGYKYTDARNKRVPEMIFRSPLAMRKAFLKGYYDTDGAKSLGNKHSFHTPNRDLLRDVQLIAWTLGCASSIHEDCEGNYLLRWVDTWDIRHALDVVGTSRLRRNNSYLYPVPEFIRDKVVGILDKIDYKSSKKDSAYASKIKKGGSVSLPGVIQLLKSYNQTIPGEVYYAYKLKEKRILESTDNTYTLSVHSSLHRFDSAGIISKNTCADIMKTVMAKLYSWIHRNNLQDDIKVLITMHDELVMEITTEKLPFIVPEVTKIMMLSEVINDSFHWPIPLTVDVKYGDSWRVKKKFYEDFPQLKEKVKEPLMEFSSQVSAQGELLVPVIEPPVGAQEPTSDSQPVVEHPKAEGLPKEAALAPDIEIMSASEDLSENKTETNDFELVYTLRDTNDLTLLHLNNILKFILQELKKKADRYNSEKKILRIRDLEGHSVLVSEYKVPVDLFLSLSRFFRI